MHDPVLVRLWDLGMAFTLFTMATYGLFAWTLRQIYMLRHDLRTVQEALRHLHDDLHDPSSCDDRDILSP